MATVLSARSRSWTGPLSVSLAAGLCLTAGSVGVRQAAAAGMDSLSGDQSVSRFYFNEQASVLGSRLTSEAFRSHATAVAFDRQQLPNLQMDGDRGPNLYTLAAHVPAMSPERRDEQVPVAEFPENLTWYVRVLPQDNGEFVNAAQELPFHAMALRSNSGERAVRHVNKAGAMEESLVPATQMSAGRAATTQGSQLPTVPEPSSLGILMTGALLLLRRRR